MNPMKLLFSFTFFSIFSSSYGLSCISDSDRLQFSFADYNFNWFKNNMSYLNMKDVEAGDVCHVKIFLQYDIGEFTVEFNENIVEVGEQIDYEVKFDTWFTFQKETGFFPRSTLEYDCSERDGCEREFVCNHIQWLLNVNYNSLQTAIQPLLVANNSVSGKFLHSVIERAIFIKCY